jgi:transcriptional regulator GlxA family with amidase domain
MQRIGFVIYPGYQVMGFAAISAFEMANAHTGEDVYEVRMLSETGGVIRTSFGMNIDSVRLDDTPLDTLIVGGGMDIQPSTPGLNLLIQDGFERCRRVASVCTGAFNLAAAGLLDGRRVTTHWAYARALQAQYPKVKVEEDRIFIVDGPIWTSAGMTAGIDLAMAMVESDLGADISRAVAKKLVVYHRRAGGQSQFSTLLELDAKSDRIQNALTFAKRNLHTPLSVEQLAEAANLSLRQFSRAFHAETGQSPAKAVETLRVEAARLMMEDGRHPIEIVARETGFGDPDRMRRAFLRAFGQPPQVIRRNARAEMAA